MNDISVLEPAITADEAYASVETTTAVEADFSQHRDCGHWRS